MCFYIVAKCESLFQVLISWNWSYRQEEIIVVNRWRQQSAQAVELVRSFTRTSCLHVLLYFSLTNLHRIWNTFVTFFCYKRFIVVILFADWIAVPCYAFAWQIRFCFVLLVLLMYGYTNLNRISYRGVESYGKSDLSYLVPSFVTAKCEGDQ